MITWLFCKKNLVISFFKNRTSNRRIFKGNPPVTYVNASPIKFADIKQEFIASIAPKPVSFENFWQMIIERRVSLVVMLTDLQEGGRRKSDQYWPDRDNEVKEIGSGISIKHEASSYQGVFITRKVKKGFIF